MLLTGPAVIVPARYAGTLARLLERAARSDGGLPPGLVDLERELRQASAAWQRITLDTSASADGTAELPQAPPAATVTVMQVAQQLGCSHRYVRYLAQREALPGRLVAGRWLFDRDDVAALVAERNR